MGPAGTEFMLFERGSRIEAALVKARAGRGTDLERDLSFGVVRQIFEPTLAEASEPERADVLKAGAACSASSSSTRATGSPRRSV